jgi:hypothetical protein
MSKYRRINPILPSERKNLEKIVKNGNGKILIRIHSILLSSRGYTIDEICKIHCVTRQTVYAWLNNWEKHGIQGLLGKKEIARKTRKTQSKQQNTAEFR